MVVICPKCKVRLRIPDERIAPGGSRFKCPKCATVMLVRPQQPGPKPLNEKKILLAHEETQIQERIKAILSGAGYEVIAATNGIDAMVLATKERPSIAILSVSLPKIYGFEVCKRLKEMKELKDIKVILITSIYSSRRYKRPPENLYGADDYLEEHEIEELLLEKIRGLKGIEERPEEKAEKKTEIPEPQPSTKEKGPATPPDMVEKARRLARTIISDIYLYNRAKFDEAIKNDTLFTSFEKEISEGLKLYRSRIPEGIRESGDYFREEIQNFIEKRKKELLS